MESTFANNKIGRYELMDRIGKGGMAQVFRARDTNLDRIVAIKILHEHLSDDPTFKERFEREAKFVGSFNHPNIVQIYDFDSFERNGQFVYYMVMPYVPGNTLRDMLWETSDKGKMLPPERALQIALNIAEALNYAHERGMVHRDVKPGNILFDERGQAVLTDFGIARLVASSSLTQEGLTVGTPAYMSPEQVAGEIVDARSDIYALGVIVYEMLAGRTPFHDDGSVSVLLKTLNEPVPSLSNFVHLPHPAIEAVILKCLAKEAHERYQTASEFAHELKLAFKGDQVTAPLPVVERKQPAQNTNSSGVRPSPTRTIQLMTQQIQTVVRSPSIIFGVGLVLLFGLVLIGVIRNTLATPQDDNSTSMTDDSSMTGAFYFTSTFDADDSTVVYWQQESLSPVERVVIPQDGVFQLVNHRRRYAMPTLFAPEYTYDNATISMNASLVAGSANTSGYGIIFRYLDANNYYTFAVDGTGRFSIWVRNEGIWRELRNAPDEWTGNSAIQPIGVVNELTVDMIGDQLTGYVNGTMVTQVRDSTFSGGAVGIYVASTAAGETDVLVEAYSVLDISESMSSSMTQEDGVEQLDGR